MEGLVFMQEVGHVFDFIFLQLTALHLAHIELNSICACRLTHQVLYVFLMTNLARLALLEARLECTVLVILLDLLKLFTSLPQYALLVPLLLPLVECFDVKLAVIATPPVKFRFEAWVVLIRVCLHLLHQHLLLKGKHLLLLSHLLPLPPLKHVLEGSSIQFHIFHPVLALFLLLGRNSYILFGLWGIPLLDCPRGFLGRLILTYSLIFYLFR